MIMLLTLLFTCLFFFGLGDMELFPWEDCCFVSVVTVNPALITTDDPGQEGFIIAIELTKFSAFVDTLLLLISCQDPGHKFGCDMVYAQFFNQNPLACPITIPTSSAMS